jgi:hypothetical protein
LPDDAVTLVMAPALAIDAAGPTSDLSDTLI